jgi:hypothetical protein
MSELRGDDPLDLLSQADPVDEDRLPSASLARMSARVQEDIMVSNDSAPARRRLVIPAAVATVLTGIAMVVVVGGARPGPEAPGTSPGIAMASPSQPVSSAGPSPEGAGAVLTASCVERYSPTAVADRDFAFDGTVTEIDGDEVTFRVGRRYSGPADDTVTLTATGMTGTAITSAGGPSLEVGERYLVAGDDHFAWACGFTQPYDASVAADWARSTNG